MGSLEATFGELHFHLNLLENSPFEPFWSPFHLLSFEN